MTHGTGEPSTPLGAAWDGRTRNGGAEKTVALPAAPPAPGRRAAAAASPPTAKPRFAQLTHASFHRADGVGGWQVKDATGEIGAEEQRLLVKRASGLDVGPLQLFLRPDQIDALPRRLVYGPVTETSASTAYWHSVPAGTDSSSRPGNVFTHVVLDRRPETPDPWLRPSDLLRSPVWLRPFGAEKVFAAELAGLPDPPWPDGGYTRAAVLAFLVDRALWRTGTLLGLLDAVSAAVRPPEPGPLVVLGVEDTANAEMWVAAVCHLMSPGTSRRLYFSTSERADGLAAAHAAKLHLVVVPCEDLRGIEPDDTVVLISDEDGAVEFVEFAETDAPQAHSTRYGSRIPVTPWSGVAAAVLRNPHVADAMLALQDDIAAEVGDRDLECGWPLAIAVVLSALVDRTGDGELDDALPAAMAQPQRLWEGTTAGSRIEQAVRLVRERALGHSAADALAAVESLDDGVERDSALDVYLDRALCDRDWLVRPQSVPVPRYSSGGPGAGTVARAHEALERVCTGTAGGGITGSPADEQGLTDAVEALRVLDVVVRAGLVPVAPGPDPADAELVSGMLGRLAGPLLLHATTGPHLVARVGPLVERTQATFVRAWFDMQLRTMRDVPVGGRVAPLVLRWLLPVPPAPPSPHQLAQCQLLPPTLFEAAAQATMTLPDPSSFLSAAVAAHLLAGPADLTRAALGPPLPIEDLAALVESFEPEQLMPVLAPALLAAEPDGQAFNIVIDRARSASDPTVAVTEATELRELASTWLRLGADDPRGVAAEFVTKLEKVFFRSPDSSTPLSEELLCSGMAADVVDQIYRKVPPERWPLVLYRTGPKGAEDDRVMRTIARIVADAVRSGVATDIDVVLAAQVSVWSVGGLSFGRRWWTPFGQAMWTPLDQPSRRLLDQVVRYRLKDRPDTYGVLLENAREWVRAEVTQPLHRLDPQWAMHEYDEFAEKWWRSVGVVDEHLIHRVLRRRRR